MFKKLGAAVATLVCLTGPQAPALAGGWDYCESFHGGARICAQYRSDNDVVSLAHPSTGYLRMGVRCKILSDSEFGWEWEVFENTGEYDRAFVNDFANHYCQGRLGVEAASNEAPEATYYMA